MAVPFLACMAAAAAFYHLPPRVLPSIQLVEGGRAGVVSRNSDGSEDLGLMQVNSIWIPALAEVARLPAPVSEALVRSWVPRLISTDPGFSPG